MGISSTRNYLGTQPKKEGVHVKSMCVFLEANESLAYLEAQVHLNPDDEIGPRLLERFRKAKADGIPFKDVKTDDIVPSEAEDDE